MLCRVLENFIQIDSCEEYKVKVFLSFSNSDLQKKFVEITKNDTSWHKFVLILESIKQNIANTTQFNYEGSCELGDIYAIKIPPHHRFYTLIRKDEGYKELYICRYGKKESQKNDKKLTASINSIHKIEINKLLPYE